MTYAPEIEPEIIDGVRSHGIFYWNSIFFFISFYNNITFCIPYPPEVIYLVEVELLDNLLIIIKP